MASMLSHRGPDAGGTHVDDSCHVAFGHRRLAIIDLSDFGAQPMSSSSGRWSLVFNGEIYNHRSLRSELESCGRRFTGHSDTETLVEAIDEWGFEAALGRTNGMFAVAAFDSERSQLTLARDRLGKSRSTGPAKATCSPSGRSFVPCGSCPVSSFARRRRCDVDVAMVVHPAPTHHLCRRPPTRAWCVARGDHRARRHSPAEQHWWSLADTIDAAVSNPSGLSMDSATSELDELLAEAVVSRLESDVPLGVFLSGRYRLVADCPLRAASDGRGHDVHGVDARGRIR